MNDSQLSLLRMLRESNALYGPEKAALTAAINEFSGDPVPVNMILHCPRCGMQHIDRPNHWADAEAPCDPPNSEMAAEDAVECNRILQEYEAKWTNPPHRSHLCKGCGHIWRPADAPTNGVAKIKTKGKDDSPLAPVSAGIVEQAIEHEIESWAATPRAMWRGDIKSKITAAVLGALPPLTKPQDTQRLQWLHSPESNNVDGYEWGIYRVKWVDGKAAEVWQTNADFSDLDAARAGAAK